MEIGYASWYGDQFHGRKTASGERYDMYQLTAAHRTAPFGTNVRVTNVGNGKAVTVRINDRGPFVKGRILDLSLAAAKEIDLISTGTARVRLEFVGATASPFRFYVQAGSFRDPENASQMVRRIAQLLPVPRAQIETVNDLNRVWLGPVETEEEAASLVEKLEDSAISAFILRR
ncbi:MAG: septal ring lytic transglycosylase RlpA family protein [Pseudomonadota bacterium]